MATLYRAYDLERQPTSFDFFTFLCNVATLAHYNDLDLCVLIIPADNPTGVKELHKSWGISIEKQHERIQRILVEGCNLGGAECKRFTSRVEGIEYFTKVGAEIEGHLLPRLTEVWKYFGDIRRLESPPKIKRFLWNLALGEKYITITLRESFRGIDRNSNVAAWLAFAERVEKEGVYKVYVLPDTDSCRTENRDLVEYVGSRLCLYENAAMNFGVNNGPMSLCFYSNAPCRVLKYEVSGAASAENLGKIGLPPGSQMPFVRDNQRIVWENDTLDNIWVAYTEWRDQNELPL